MAILTSDVVQLSPWLHTIPWDSDKLFVTAQATCAIDPVPTIDAYWHMALGFMYVGGERPLGVRNYIDAQGDIRINDTIRDVYMVWLKGENSIKVNDKCHMINAVLSRA